MLDRTPSWRGQGDLPVRSMDEMLGSLAPAPAGDSVPIRLADGWRRPLPDGSGFRQDYDASVANGGWEFYRLEQGLCIAMIDMVASRSIPRRHLMDDQLVLSAMVEGAISFQDIATSAGGRLVHGECAVYGLSGGSEVRTVYESGCTLKWVSVFIDRKSLFAVTGLEPGDLPPRVREFVLAGGHLPYQSVPLSYAASLAAMRVMNCPYQNGLRRAFFTAKALEIACEILFALAHSTEEDAHDSVAFSANDYLKLAHARKLIEDNLEQPPNIAALAAAVGLTRQKLQLGFRRMYGDTVARVRDKQRMEHALNLVRDSGLSMIDIALETGYEHAASFTRAFKASYGVSPIQMRRMMR